MQLLSKIVEIRPAKGKPLLDEIESYFLKTFSIKEKKLRYFVVSAKKNALELEVSFLRE